MVVSKTKTPKTETEDPLAKRTIKSGLVLSFHKWRGVLQTKTLAIQKLENQYPQTLGVILKIVKWSEYY